MLDVSFLTSLFLFDIGTTASYFNNFLSINVDSYKYNFGKNLALNINFNLICIAIFTLVLKE